MKVSRILLSAALLVGIGIVAVQPVSAIETMGGGSVQGYASDARIDNGTIVRLTGEAANRVTVATKEQVQNMFGVTVDRSVLPLTLSTGEIENEAFVAVSGTYNVLVSTQAGEIKAGDYITLSSLNGVGMKAGTEETTVFGRANAAFNEGSVVLGSTELKDTNGNKNQTVKFGSIPVTIDIRSNPNDESTEADVPDFLKRVGAAIAEKEVSPTRLYISVGIAAASLIAAIAVLYAGVRNGVISIGRNPMSKKSIFRALLEVILTSVVILIIGLFAVYLLLRL